jgi:Alginate export
LLFKPSDAVRFYIQGQDAREIASDRPDVPGALGAEGDNPFDFRQAWLEIGGGRVSPWSLKAGRQVLLYGDQRLVGPLEWSTLSRTFDAVKLRYDSGDGLWIDAFVSSVVIPDRNDFDESDHDSIFSGIYAHILKTGSQDTEVYLLHLDDRDRDDDFITLGTHWKSTPGALVKWDYEAEFAYQTGAAGGRDLSAFASYVEAGYTFGHPWKPRVSLEYSYGSGNDNAADGDQGAFQNLFPTNHPHYGYMDLFSWRNMHNVVLHLSAKPCAKFRAGLDFHAFWLADTADAWRRANGRTEVRPVNAGAGSFAGSELDCLLTWSPCANLTLTAGYSHFFGGQYLKDTSARNDADFACVMTGIRF